MKNSQKGFLVPLLIIIIAALVIGGGVYIYTKNKSVNLLSDTNAQTSSSVKSNIVFSISNDTLQVLRNNESVAKFVLNSEAVAVLTVAPDVKPFITDADVNFDGYKDVGVLTGIGYAGVNSFYDFYLFNPTTNSFEKNAILTGITLSSIDPIKKQIISTYKSGPGYETVIYQWNGSTYVKSQPKKEMASIPTPKISVSGMSQYTDSDFGFSFWYPSGWVTKPAPSQQYIVLSGGTVVKTVVVGPANDPNNSIAIQEFTSSDLSITDNSDCGPADGCGKALTHYFDPSTHAWMTQNHLFEGSISTNVANVSTNTIGGLHLLRGNARFGDDVIIPLSARNFLVVSSVEVGTIQIGSLAKTITASDPSVATPVSASEQIKAIQAEAKAYGVQ